MQKNTDWLAGESFLRENAKELLPFINEYGHCTLEPDGLERYFEVLLTGIAAQQLPPESSAKIMEQLRHLAGNPVIPEKLLALTDETIATCGLSAIKITYMKEFARLVLDRTIDFTAFAEMTDAQIVKRKPCVGWGSGPSKCSCCFPCAARTCCREMIFC